MSRLRSILQIDVRYVYVKNGRFHLVADPSPCVEGEDGIAARFYRGASIDALAVDHATSRRAIEAAIRTMHRFWKGMRS